MLSSVPTGQKNNQEALSLTTPSNDCPCGVHFVGSIPAANNTDVFALIAGRLPRHLRRLPDGETGIRNHWISWQYALLKSLPFVEPANDQKYYTAGGERWRLKPGVDPASIVIPSLGYADAAIESYREFARLRKSGAIGAGIRFQVSLPTPLAPIHALFVIDSQAAIEPAYERRMLIEIDEMVAAIPAEDLAIQWDTAIEFALLEGVLPSYITDLEAGIVERLVRIGNAVPLEVELGYHLCYGDSGGKHFKEPEDTDKLVRVANAVSAGLARPLQWMHLPVPQNRIDDDYYRALADLRLCPETELYLGLVHHTDDIAGNEARIATAQKFAPRFGVSGECGLGRRPKESIPRLLDLYAKLAEPIRT